MFSDMTKTIKPVRKFKMAASHLCILSTSPHDFGV